MIELKIPNEWVKVSISDIADVDLGKTPKKSDYLSTGDYKVVKFRDVDYTGIDWSTDKDGFIGEKSIDSLRELKLHDVLITASAHSSEHIGRKICFVNKLPKSYRKIFFCGELLGISPKAGYLSAKYCFYYFLSHTGYKEIQSHVKGVHLTSGQARNMSFPFTPQPEQDRIIEIVEELFSDLDNAIENLKKAQGQLRVYRQAVLKCAFEGQFTKGWRHSNPYPIDYLKTFMVRIDELNSLKDGGDLPRRLPPINLKDLYVLPENWVWLEAHKVCQSVRDGTHDTPRYVDNGIPLVTSKNLKEGKIDFEDVDFISHEDHEKIQDRSGVDLGDILFGMIGTIGNPVVITDKRAFSIKNVGLFKMNQGLVISGYLKYWLDSSLMMHILQEKDLVRGTTQKFIALGGLRVLPVPVPSVNEQNEILNEIESRFSVCDKLEETIESSLRQAESLRQSILKQAFEGKLTEQWRKEHKDLICGENSAEALLKKIKAEKEALQVKPKGRKKHD